MEIKHPREGDVLPIPLEFQSFNPEWVWLMGNAVLIGAGAHDIVILLRLVKWGEMPPTWLHRMLQHVKQECRKRGYHRYMVFLAKDIEEEKKLLKVASRDGAYFEPFNGDIVVGAI